MQILSKLSSTLKVKDKDDGWRGSKGRGKGIPSVVVCDPTRGDIVMFDDADLHAENVHAVVACTAQGDVEDEHKSESVDGDSEKYGSLLLLLESEFALDAQYGMQRLVTLANTEFINAETKGSVAEAIVFDADSDAAERLRRSFLRHLNSEVLRLAALRVLASTLELAKTQKRGTTTLEVPVDFTSRHWGLVLAALAYTDDLEEIERAEATLSIKCLRLLLELDSATTVDSYIRGSLLPFLQGSYREACEANDGRLQREARGMLSSLDIHWTEIC